MILSHYEIIILVQVMGAFTCSVQAFFVDYTTRTPQYKLFRSQMRQESSTLENDEQDDFSDDSASTSDEVALLAARAYLQRKHRVQWDQKEARRVKLLNSLALTRNLSSDSQVTSSLTPVTDPNIKQDGIGYFWENPNELRYLRTGRPRLDFEFTDTDGLDFDMIEEVDNHHDQLRDKRDNVDENDSDDELSESDFEDEGIFTSFPQSPPAQHERHSQARKKLFQDPEWKIRWYKARWGEKASMTGDAVREEQRKKRIEALVESIPSELLASSELNALTDDEIEDAISTYIIANRKKSLSMKNGYMKKKKLTQVKGNQHKPVTNPNEEQYPIVTPFIVNPDASEDEITKLLEAKRKRSERAKKAYQTRLDKEALKESVKPSVDSVGLRNQSRVMSSLKSKGMSPAIKEATDRINASIIWGIYPDTADIKTILRPQKLSGRKDLLLEVLNKSLGLRGRCVPAIGGSSKDKLQRFYSHATKEDVQHCKKKFATLCSLQELGMFIIYKLEK